ncbi:endosomal/lysosomal proton channel TMEM175-like [Hydra vulgaris]|uniref:Endosomal/lysosomal proton channel TMEM175 n=1 Tax=Hydra vulgaris TaxID=6087 RepID=A0ABM4DBY3_HYDVU
MEKKCNPTMKEQYLNNLRTLDQYYDEYLNEITINSSRPGEVVSGSRFLGYIDTLMATCATFLVLPIRNLNEMEKNESLWSFIYSIRAHIIVFFLGFIIVLNIWENINIRAMVVKRIDDFILIFITLSLLATSVIPFSLAFQQHYIDKKVSIILTCGILGLIQVIDIILVLYAMKTPAVLHIAMQSWSTVETKNFRNRFLIRPVISLVLLVIGVIFCFVHYIISLVFIGVFTLMPTVRKLVLYYRRRILCPKKMGKELFGYYFSKGNILKERVEAMSDGAMAVIASILVLDLISKKLPTQIYVKENGLYVLLVQMKLEILTFMTAFITVSVLWYTNHTVLHLFKSVTTVMLHLQKIFLAFSCLCPLAGSMVFEYSSHENDDSNHSIFLSSIIICLSSSSNLMILLYGLFTGSKYLHHWAAFGSFKANVNQHLYVIIKASNIPFWSLISIIGSFSSPKIAKYIMYTCIAALLLSFFILKLVFMNHVGKTNNLHKPLLEDINTKIERNENLQRNRKKTVSSIINFDLLQ